SLSPSCEYKLFHSHSNANFNCALKVTCQYTISSLYLPHEQPKTRFFLQPLQLSIRQRQSLHHARPSRTQWPLPQPRHHPPPHLPSRRRSPPRTSQPRRRFHHSDRHQPRPRQTLRRPRRQPCLSSPSLHPCLHRPLVDPIPKRG